MLDYARMYELVRRRNEARAGRYELQAAHRKLAAALRRLQAAYLPLDGRAIDPGRNARETAFLMQTRLDLEARAEAAVRLGATEALLNTVSANTGIVCPQRDSCHMIQ